jgi:isoleucyl-tRNA synthetase
LYFDIRKDALYCDHPGSLRRRAARTVLDILLDTLCAWLAPVLVFTADEAWAQRHGEPAGAVHRRLFPAIPAAWHDPALAERWARLRDVRRVVTGALEVERREKRIGSSLQARPIVHLTPALADAIQGLDLAELCITSGLELSTAPAPDGAFRLDEVEGVAVVPAPAQGAKCQRCWQVLPEVSEASGGLCRRCADAVARRERAA